MPSRESDSPASQSRPNNTKESKKHTQKESPSSPPKGLRPPEPDSGEEKVYTELYKCLRSAMRENNIRPQDQTMKTGKAHLRQFVSQNYATFEELKDVLEWYCSHCSKEDILLYKLPTVRSCRQFVKLFDWIKNVKDKNECSEEDYEYRGW